MFGPKMMDFLTVFVKCKSITMHECVCFTCPDIFAGDVAVYYIPRATVTIMANDDANGIFSFSPPFSLSIQEGDTAHFQ